MKTPKPEIRLAAPKQSAGGNPKQSRSPKTEIVHGPPQAIGNFQFSIFNLKLLVALALLSTLSSQLSTAFAQSYSIDWWTVDGGGGTSTGGVYTVSGTIGQPDAGTMTGGNYALVGGFWGLIAAVQTPGAPLLTITRSNTLVIVSWPAPATGWVLEQTNALLVLSAGWPQVPPPYTSNAATISVTFTNVPPVGNQFFRLHKP